MTSIFYVNGEKAKKEHDWTVIAKICGHDNHLKVDTGAGVNLLPLSMFKRLHLSTTPASSSMTPRCYGGETLEHVGKVCLNVQVYRRSRLNIFITKKGKRAFLGLEACEQFGSVNRVNSVLDTCSSRQCPNFQMCSRGWEEPRGSTGWYLKKTVNQLSRRPNVFLTLSGTP